MKTKSIFAGIAIAAILLIALVPCLIFPKANGIAEAATDFKTVGKSAYLVDFDTGTVMYARHENERLPIASMMKIMTALLTFEAVERGDVTLDDDVSVSETAAGMGGSQVFLDAGTTHKLGNLLRTVIVASANDSCVALAEHIEGSVPAFVSKMNMRAKELGMMNTNFVNCTGLPAAESFSSAKDVSIMFRKLLDHPLYFEYAKVWLEDYVHPDGRVTTITNTNKLVRFYEGCDGGKTGFTNEAKFCLSATAKKGDMRVIAVLCGVDSAKLRNAAVSAMFDYAFGEFENKVLLKAGKPMSQTVEVKGGKSQTLQLTVDMDVSQFAPRNDGGKFELKYELPPYVKAPIRQGDYVGKVYLTKDGVVVLERNVVAMENVERLSFFDAIKIIGKRWGIAKY